MKKIMILSFILLLVIASCGKPAVKPETQQPVKIPAVEATTPESTSIDKDMDDLNSMTKDLDASDLESLDNELKDLDTTIYSK